LGSLSFSRLQTRSQHSYCPSTLRMTTTLVAYCFSFCIIAQALRDQEQQRHASAFHSFMQQHGRTYDRNSLEYSRRFALFSQTLTDVETHNQKSNRLWTAGINHLSDRNQTELAGLRGWRGGAPRKGNDAIHISKSSFLENSAPYPDSFSWSGLHSLSQVRNQRACGSCWAVATSTVLNAHSEIHQGDKQRTFSEQELVSCVKNPHECGGHGGCRGATVELALKYVSNHGLSTEEERPYQGVDARCPTDSNAGGQSMLSMQGVHKEDESMDDMSQPGIHQVHPSKPGALLGLKAWERLPVNDYDALMGALIKHGPVAVSAAAAGWSKYESGIFTSVSKTVDHAVTLIGYGQEDKSKAKYWLIQNSWTDRWGEHGRIRLHRQDTDSKNCGTDAQPELGTGCKGGPKEVTVCGDCGVLYDSVVPHFHHAVERRQ